MMKDRARLACKLAILFLLGFPSVAAALEVHVKHLLSTRLVYEGGKGKAGETTTTFVQGEEALLLCQYEYGQPDDGKGFAPWEVWFTKDGHDIGMYPVNKYEVPHAAPFRVWKAEGPGQHKIGCRLEMLKDTDPSNNKAEVTITVKPRPPLTAARIPAPVPSSPSPGQKLVLVPNFSFVLWANAPKGKVVGYPDMISYSLSSTYVQHWNVEIARMSGSGKLSYPLAAVGQFQEKMGSHYFFGTPLTKKWLEERGAGPGRYEARFYFSETANGVTTKGQMAIVPFDLVEPLKAGSAPSGGVKMAPSPGGGVSPQPPPQDRVQPPSPVPVIPPSRLRR
jgi:hypothetical protein